MQSRVLKGSEAIDLGLYNSGGRLVKSRAVTTNRKSKPRPLGLRKGAFWTGARRVACGGQPMQEPASAETRCLGEINAFIQGGLPGLARLELVLPSLFAYYKVVGLEEQARCLRAVGLAPARTQYGMTFVMPDPDAFTQAPPAQPPSP